AGRIGALLIAGVNPVYSMPNPADFVEGLKNVEVSLAFSMKEDETAKLCNYIAATPHYLESWGDIQLTKRTFTLMQPTIKPLFDTRQFQEFLLRWSDNDTSYYDYIRETWASSLGDGSWNDALHDGAFEADAPAGITALSGNTATAAPSSATLTLQEGGFELEL